MYFEPVIISSCWRPLLQVVLAGGVDVSSLQDKVTLVPSRAVASGSPTGYGDSGNQKQTFISLYDNHQVFVFNCVTVYFPLLLLLK